MNLYHYFEALDLTCLLHLVTMLQHVRENIVARFSSSGFSCRLLIVMFRLAEVIERLTAENPPLSMNAFTVIKVPCA